MKTLLLVTTGLLSANVFAADTDAEADAERGAP